MQRSDRRRAQVDARKRARRGDKGRLVYYGANCVYWTDNADDLARAGEAPHLPVCPKCGGVFYQQSADDWWKGVHQYATKIKSKTYIAFIEWLRGKCFKTPALAAEEFAKETGQLPVAETGQL